MGMREKLIEALSQVQDYGTKSTYEENSVTIESKGNAYVADQLIANGVVISNSETTTKWIPVTDKLPDDEKKVLCILDDGFFCILEWTSWEWLWNDGHNVYAEKDVTHWMPLPEPPAE